MKEDTTDYKAKIEAFLKNSSQDNDKSFYQDMLNSEFQQKIEMYLKCDFENYEKINYESIDIPTATMYQFIMIYIKKKRRKQLFYRIAAVLIPFLFLLGAYSLYQHADWESDPYNEVYVSKGESIQLCLQDGTRIWVNADSKVSYPLNFNRKKRSLKLEGEAYFKVAPDKKKPFEIELNGLVVKVLGTSFNIKAYPEQNNIIVALDEGKVTVLGKDQNKNDSYLLAPGDILEFDKIRKTYTQNHKKNVADYSNWKNNILIFNDTPLREVVTTLERKFDVQLIIEDKELETLSFTMNYEKESLEAIINYITLISPIEIIKERTNVWKIKKKN